MTERVQLSLIAVLALLIVCLTVGAMHWDYLHRNDRGISVTVTVPR